MCGIIMSHNQKEPVNEWIVNQFEDQHSRGTKGFGIIDIDKNGDYTVSRATEGAKFMFDLHKKESSCLIVHHRIPTSTPNYLSQTHPIEVDNGSLANKYLVIHNGCISNANELKKKHEELGFVYTTAETFEEKNHVNNYFEKFNDSESLAIEVARFIEKQTEKIGAYGSAAFIAVQIDKKTNKAIKIFFGRNTGNPLNMSFSRGKLRLSSEGEGDNIKEFTLYSWDFKGKMKKVKMPFAELPKPTYQPIGFQEKSNTYSGTQHGHTQYPYRDESLPWEDYKSEYDDYNEEIEQIKEFRTEEIEKELESFFEALEDKDTTYIADVEQTLKDIRLILTTAKKEAEEVHELASLADTYKMNEELPV